MKKSIEWHKECAKNRAATLDRKHQELKERMKRLSNESKEIVEENMEIAFYYDQIAEATKRGLDGFDNEKLLKKRAKI